MTEMEGSLERINELLTRQSVKQTSLNVTRGLSIILQARRELNRELAFVNEELDGVVPNLLTLTTPELFSNARYANSQIFGREVNLEDPYVVTGTYFGVEAFDENSVENLPDGYSVDPVRLCLHIQPLVPDAATHDLYIPRDKIVGEIVAV